MGVIVSSKALPVQPIWYGVCACPLTSQAHRRDEPDPLLTEGRPAMLPFVTEG